MLRKTWMLFYIVFSLTRRESKRRLHLRSQGDDGKLVRHAISCYNPPLTRSYVVLGVHVGRPV